MDDRKRRRIVKDQGPRPTCGLTSIRRKFVIKGEHFSSNEEPAIKILQKATCCSPIRCVTRLFRGKMLHWANDSVLNGQRQCRIDGSAHSHPPHGQKSAPSRHVVAFAET